jgi:hypothetical protein
MTFIAGRWWHNRPTVKGVLLVVVVVLSGCYGLPTTPAAPADCDIREGTHFAFVGSAVGYELGLSSVDPRVARWWVTSERFQYRGPIPIGHSPPFLPIACGIYPDGTYVVEAVQNDWHPPFDASSS